MTTGIVALAVFSIWNILKLAQAHFSSLQNKVKMEVEANELLFSVQQNLGMGINLVAAYGPLNNVPFDTPTGRILASYNLDNWTPSTGSGNIDVLAFFLRETLSSRAGAVIEPDATRFQPTALFFQRPTIDKYGVVYVSTSANRNMLSPRGTSSYFEGVVDFAIQNITTAPFDKDDDGAPDENRVVSVTFRMTQRHYLPNFSNLPMVWCPPKFMQTPACRNTRGYFDYVKIFTVKVRNNIVGKSRIQKIAEKGNLGEPLYPPIDRRVFDGIYFLRPTYPPGALVR